MAASPCGYIRVAEARRCWYVVCEPVVRQSLDLAALVAGDGRPLLQAGPGWQALAAHLPSAVALTAAQLERLGRLDREQWVVVEAGDTALQALLDAGLALARDDRRACAQVDARLRRQHWWGLSALAWQHARWHGEDSVGRVAAAGLERIDGLVGQFGLPPPSAAGDDAGDGLALAPGTPSALDALIARRVTCRNFDTRAPLPLQALADVFWRSLAERAALVHASGARFAKKAVPSAGGLHATEAYLLLRGVDGVADGAYHYQPASHRLRPHRLHGDDALGARALRWLAGQYWFADAPVLVVLASRHARLQWKYRAHSKAWRAAVLDVGHISQAIYLAATECGLGAFITAAVNEADIAADLGLGDFGDAPLAVAGFGVRAQRQQTAEFDPAAAVWPPAG